MLQWEKSESIKNVWTSTGDTKYTIAGYPELGVFDAIVSEKTKFSVIGAGSTLEEAKKACEDYDKLRRKDQIWNNG